MSHGWVGALVLTLGWLSVGAGEGKDAEVEGVSLGKPIVLPAPAPDAPPPLAIVRGQSPDDPPPPAPDESTDEDWTCEPVGHNLPAIHVKAGRSCLEADDSTESSVGIFAADRSQGKSGTTEVAASTPSGGTAFAEDRPIPVSVTVRASAPTETATLFAVDRPPDQPKAIKRPALRETSGRRAEDPVLTTLSGEKCPPVVAKGAVASSRPDQPKPADTAAKKEAASSAQDGDDDVVPTTAPASDIQRAVGSQADEPPVLDKDKVDALELPKVAPKDGKPSPDSTPASRTPAEKQANSPEPRTVPKAVDCTCAASIGSPRTCCKEDRPLDRVYGSAEYLVWFTKADHVPPLVTTGPPSSNGILGQPGTIVLFGGPHTSINDDVRQGGRFTLGYWLDDCHQCGIEGTYFFLGDETTNFNANSNAFPLLARPFFRINTNSEFSEIATGAGLATGSVSVQAPSSLWGAELNARHNLCCGCTYKVDGLAGFRYLDLAEGVHITENLIESPTQGQFANDHVVVTDRFDTHNQFYGGQVGLDGEVRRGRFFVDLRGKVALGDNHETLTIQGAQIITDPAGNVRTFRGGLLALPSNMGRFTSEHFSVVPELGVSLGYQVTDQLRVTVGYNLLYWTSVIRPGEQIDRVVDETQIPNFGAIHPPAGQNRPMVLFKQSDYWAQGLTFGLEFRY